MESENLNTPQEQPAENLYVIKPSADVTPKVTALVILGIILVSGGVFGYYKVARIPTGDELLDSSYRKVSSANTMHYDYSISITGFDSTDSSDQASSGVLKLAINGALDATNEENRKLSLDFDLSLNSSYVKDSLSGSLKVIGENLYIKVDNLPSIWGSNDSSNPYAVFMNSWVKFDMNNTEGISPSLSQLTGIKSGIDKKRQEEFKEVFDKASVLNATSVESGEKINGQSTYKVAFDLNRPGFVAFVDELSRKYDPSATDEKRKDLEEQLSKIDLTGEIWVSKSSRLPLKMSMDIRPHIDYFDNLVIKIENTWSEYDKPVTIDAPSEFVDYSSLSANVQEEGLESLAEANNVQRTSNVITIINATSQYMVDNKGKIPVSFTSTPREICKTNSANCAGLVNLSVLTNDMLYLIDIPIDPSCDSKTCSTNGTGYMISKSINGRITVSAPHAQLGEVISVTR